MNDIFRKFSRDNIYDRTERIFLATLAYYILKSKLKSFKKKFAGLEKQEIWVEFWRPV